MKTAGHRFSSWAALGLGVSLALLGGCNIIPPPSADLTRYYVLTIPALRAAATTPKTGALRVGLRNVDLAPYLRKGLLVVRTGENEVTFPSDARWAEPLEQEIVRSLRAGLTAAPTVGRVHLQPFPLDGERDFDVSVQVFHCEGASAPGSKSATVKFSALIEISTGGMNPQLVARKLFVAPESAWDGRDFAQLVGQLSSAVAALSQEVVAILPDKN